MKKQVTIKDLKLNLFVRKALNQDHVLYLAELLENGVTLPPIKINKDFFVIDGRHRIEAYELNNQSVITAEVVDITELTELIANAYLANVGGSLPPKPEDTEHTVMLLLEQGVTHKQVGEILRLPAGMARKYISEVKSRMTRAKLMRAAAAVTEGGLTVAKAAEQHDVEVAKLKEVLGSKGKKHKMGIAEAQRSLTRTYKGLGSKNASLMRTLLNKYEDGDVTTRQVAEILAHLDDLQKRQVRALVDWKKRFNGLAKD